MVKELTVYQRLGYLRDAFSDQIPQEMISGYSHNKRFKVRRNWFQAVTVILERVLDEAKNPEIKTEVNHFLAYCFSSEFKNQPLVTSEDVLEANRIINLVLSTQKHS